MMSTFGTEFKEYQVLLSIEGRFPFQKCVKSVRTHYCGCSQTSEAVGREDSSESILNSVGASQYSK